MSGRGRIACVCLAGLASGLAGASQPLETRFDRSHPWAPERLEAIAVSSDGSLSLAPVLRTLNLNSDSAAPYLLCQTRDAEGNLYVGAAGPARVYRFSPLGVATLLFQGNEMQVSALAVDSENRLYVATSPRGRVYRVSPSGEAQPFFEVEERYIWSLLSDASGTLWVGTGERGKLYRVDSAGRGETAFDSPDPHITALAHDADGSLLVGTDGRGLVYRIRKDGAVRTLLEGGSRQVSDLAVGARREIYVGLVGSKRAEKRPRRREDDRHAEELLTPTPFDSQSPLMLGEDAPPVSLDESIEPPAGPSPQSRIVMLDAAGAAQEVWRSASEWLHALAVDATGAVHFGTGEPAHIYRLDAPNRWTLLGTPEAGHLTSIGTTAEGRLFLLTGRPGRVLMAGDAVAKSGTLETKPLDAGALARWGQVRWRADEVARSQIEFYSRSGNSARPDSAWSDWSAATIDASGSPIVSPAGRYLQLRVTLERGKDAVSPKLRELSFSYLPTNRPPQIEHVRLHPPGEYFLPSEKPAANSRPLSSGRKRQRAGLRTVSWRASDPDGDRPVTTLKLRGPDSGQWTVLADGILAGQYSWSVSHLEEGWYELMLEASDARDNPPESTARTAASPLLLKVDHTAPRIEVERNRLGEKPPQIEFQVTDALSALKGVLLWIDQAPPRRLVPDDGLEDSRRESYRWQGSSLPQRLRIEASDSDGNRAQWRWVADKPAAR